MMGGMSVRVTGTIQRYSIALLAAAVGIGLKYALETVAPQADAPFLLMAVVVIVAGWFGGVGPGMLATVVTTFAAWWLFMEPRGSLALTAPGAVTNLVIYWVEGTFISLLSEARLRAEVANDRAREELEDRVRDRTAELSSTNASLEQEVAERRRVEAELFREREYLTALLKTMSEGIVAVDASGRVTLVNEAAREIYGLPDGPPPPYEEWEHYHRTYYGDGMTPMPHDERPLSRVMHDESLVDVEKVVILPDGRRRDLLSTGRTIFGPGGERLGAVVVFRDETERKRQDEELRRYAAQLQRSNRELQDFASVASHDLQEPLRKILAFGDRLRARYEGALGDDGRDYLGRMLNAAGRMSTLINDLLTFSRVTTRAQPFRPVDLGEVARDVVSDLEARVEQTGGRVEIGAMPVVEADATQVRQLLQNLIGNALKFHRPGEPPVVRVEGEVVRSPDPVCQFTVSDNGIGFDEKYLDRIFNVFQRLHGRNTYEGTGIGLAVCRKIAERHHGSITARSVPGRGSTFIVTLPVRQPEQQEQAPESGEEAANGTRRD